MITRAFVAEMFHERGLIVLGKDDDATCYVATADYIKAHGHLSTELDSHYRVFAGLPLLMAALDHVVGNMILSGYLIVVASGIAVLFLIQYWWDKFRLTLVSSVFLPYTIATTAHIFSEGPAMLCLLIGG